MFAEPPPRPAFAPIAPPVAGWRRWDSLIGLGMLVGSLLVTWILVAAVLLGFDLTGAAEDVTLVTLGIGYELAFAGSVLFLAHRRGISISALGFRRPDRWGPLGIAVVGAYATLIAWGALVTALQEAGVDTSWIEGGNEIPVDEGEDTVPLVALLALFAVAVMVVAPLAEEVFFRGLLFKALDGVWVGWAAIVVSGLAFGAFHVNLSVLVPFSVIGMLFAWAFKASGSLWVTVVAHFIVNTVSFIVTVIEVIS